MGRGMTTLVLLVAMLAVLGGCRAMTGKTASDTADDASITASVKTKLVADKAANLTRVDVDTNNGTVYLNGPVESPDQLAGRRFQVFEAVCNWR